jgi:hypothetical protein
MSDSGLWQALKSLRKGGHVEKTLTAVKGAKLIAAKQSRYADQKGANQSSHHSLADIFTAYSVIAWLLIPRQLFIALLDIVGHVVIEILRRRVWLVAAACSHAQKQGQQ